MKKTGLAILMVAILVVVVLFADRSWLRQHKPVAQAQMAAKTANLAVAPDVAFKDLQGNDVHLSQFKGKVVLLNFWATWCEPCRIEIPWMIEFQQKYGPRGFTVVGVAMDDEGRKVVEPFVHKPQFDVGGGQMAMNYPIVLGNDGIASEFGGLIGLPTSVLISRDGKVVKRIIGLVNYDTLSKEIEGLL